MEQLINIQLNTMTVYTMKNLFILAKLKDFLVIFPYFLNMQIKQYSIYANIFTVEIKEILVRVFILNLILGYIIFTELGGKSYLNEMTQSPF